MSVSRLAFVKREATLIVAFIIVAAALLVVIRLGSEIREDGTSDFDRWLLLSLRQPRNLAVPIGPAWLQPVLVDITALGGATALTLLTVSVVGYLLAAKKWTTAALIAAATISGSLIGQLLKVSFARARPTIVPHFVEIHSLSYPSGHATNSAVVFLTLGVLLARAQTARATRIYVLVAAMLFTALIGCSRVYNGVHWPTDVIAGWVIGGSWALLWWAIALRAQRSRVASSLD
ncbi:phosphatase PAP2 family protein [Sphingomonas sp. H39-1-10]|uniref:phosphatase PAP2 family protein n=1 Tax=Sphingomonas pollutisoli TaxID=3030829 RepID=UPI0023B9579F|nr:phosphatase PAP2 family protein [Sphingomonas pollutisoli]MDF0490525.1 phosphatase PAP2 family protein [Sphingomonas pollutisoli]